ncbi:MAG: hypothetical protein DRJ60_05880 [Thermoprotei archaeon]|nr:MAG: hypothetical protein DRJ60_05880 [Thermoprotei archaeon]
MAQERSHIEILTELLVESIIAIDEEFAKPKSKYRTLFKVLLVTIALNILFKVPFLKDNVRRALTPTIANISKVTGLKYEATRRYIKLLEERGIVRKTSYCERMGWAFAFMGFHISDDMRVDCSSLPLALNTLSELTLRLERIVNCDHELKLRVSRFWMKTLKIVYNVVHKIYDITKNEGSKNTVKKLKLRDFLWRIKDYIDSLKSGRFDMARLSSDINALSKFIKELLMIETPNPNSQLIIS